MITSTVKAVIPCDVRKVWAVVLAVEDYTWRSDLSRTEVISDKQFIEYTKDGYPTTFTVTAVEPEARWEFDMENTNMKGHWVGRFTARGGETEVSFTECVTGKKLLMRPIIKPFLKKQQARFVEDLIKAVS